MVESYDVACFLVVDAGEVFEFRVCGPCLQEDEDFGVVCRDGFAFELKWGVHGPFVRVAVDGAAEGFNGCFVDGVHSYSSHGGGVFSISACSAS